MSWREQENVYCFIMTKTIKIQAFCWYLRIFCEVLPILCACAIYCRFHKLNYLGGINSWNEDVNENASNFFTVNKRHVNKNDLGQIIAPESAMINMVLSRSGKSIKTSTSK